MNFLASLYQNTAAIAVGAGGVTYALDLNFAAMTDASEVADAGVTFSRGSHATMYDSTGKLTFAPNNLLLNSATLSTQSVTLAAGNFILSFKGTGSVAISGGYSGTLNGTGVSNRVSLAFTATAGSSTFTVTGTVTEAQVEQVTYETSPRAYNATTSAAYYGPRLDYDPATLVAKGLLVEEARTNAQWPSIPGFNLLWTTSSITMTTNDAVAPDGTTTATKLTATSTVNCHVYNGMTITAAAWTQTFFAKAGTAPCVWIRDAANSDASFFNLSTGTVQNTGTGHTCSIAPVGDGWYRCSVTHTSATTTGFSVIGVCDANFGTSVTNGTYAYVWGAQAEAGSFATSYQSTSSASVTRSASIATMTGSEFTGVWNATEGTILVDFRAPASGTRTLVAFDDNTANEAIILYTSGTSLKYKVVDGGVTQCDITVGTIAANTDYKVAARYKVNDFAAVLTGGSVQADTAGTIPTVDRARIGSSQAGEYLCEHVARVRYANTAQNDAALLTMVA